jgi:hypothetical protein
MDRRPEPREERVRAFVLGARAAVRQVAARDQEVGPDALEQRGERMLDIRVLSSPGMEVRDVHDPGGHGRER